MSKRHIPESHGSHPNVTPLIDVVMVLIVFFMLVAKIGVNTGADEKIHVPESVLGSKIEDMGNTLVLNVSPQSVGSDVGIVTALVTNSATGESAITELKLQDAANQNQVINTLKFYRYGKDMVKGTTGGKPENADNDQFQVIIRGDKDMHYSVLEPVLLACAMANVKSVNFNTGIKTQEVVASDK